MTPTPIPSIPKPLITPEGIKATASRAYLATGYSRDELLAMRTKNRARLSRESLYDFVRFSWNIIEPGTIFEDAWYVKVICDHVQRQLEEWHASMQDRRVVQTARNMVINIPPRMLKSRIANVCASAWAWLRWPHMKIMSLSSNPRVSENCARDVLNLIRSDWYQRSFDPDWKITGDALSLLVNSAGGTRAARGLDAKITGEGADWQIIDDPHDAAQVFSETMRLAVTEGYTAAVYNRVQDPERSIRTGIMQRLHELDWTGACASDWMKVILPMEFEPSRATTNAYGWRDPRTKDGEILHPTRFTRDFLAKEKARLGSFGYAGQMQQSPAPLDGGLFKVADFCTFDDLEGFPTCDSYTISVDAAFKKTAKGSRVSIMLLGRKGGKRFVLDNDTRPMDYTDTILAIRSMRKKWLAKGVRVSKVLIEDKANGPAIITELRSVWSDVCESSPGSDSKEARAMSVQPQVQARSVYIPKYAPWRDTFLHEMATFPNGAHDDQVDALVQALIDMKLSNDAARAMAMNQA